MNNKLASEDQCRRPEVLSTHRSGHQVEKDDTSLGFTANDVSQHMSSSGSQWTADSLTPSAAFVAVRWHLYTWHRWLAAPPEARSDSYSAGKEHRRKVRRVFRRGPWRFAVCRHSDPTKFEHKQHLGVSWGAWLLRAAHHDGLLHRYIASSKTRKSSHIRHPHPTPNTHTLYAQLTRPI